MNTFELNREKKEASTVDENVNVTDTVVRKILTYIHEHKLKPGDKIPSEAMLSKTFGFGRGSIRESIRALSQLGVLSVSNGRRSEVSAINGDNIAILIDHAVRSSQVSVVETWDLRSTLEARIAKLAALRRTEQQLAKMRHLCVQMMEAKNDFVELTKLDIELHLIWAEASDNPLFLLNIQSLKIVMTWSGPIGWGALGSNSMVEKHIEIHSLITETIAERRANEAVNYMKEHFDVSRNCLFESGHR